MSDTHPVHVVEQASSPVPVSSSRHGRPHGHREAKAALVKNEQVIRDEAWERRMKQLNPVWTPYRDSLADVS